MESTSVLAYHDLKDTGKLTGYRKIAFDLIQANPGHTQEWYKGYYENREMLYFPTKYSCAESMRKRISELVALKLIYSPSTVKENGRERNTYFVVTDERQCRLNYELSKEELLKSYEAAIIGNHLFKPDLKKRILKRMR